MFVSAANISVFIAQKNQTEFANKIGINNVFALVYTGNYKVYLKLDRPSNIE